MSYPKLRGAIREKFETQEAFAQAMGLHPTTLSNKLQNKVDWTRREILCAAQLLGLPAEAVPEYFNFF